MFILYFSKYSWALFWDAVNLLENSLTFCASLLSRFWPVLSLWLIILYYWGRASGRLQSPWALQAGPVNALLSMAMLSLLCMLTPPLCGFFPHKPPSVISWILHALSLQTLNSLSACVVLSFLRLCPVMSSCLTQPGHMQPQFRKCAYLYLIPLSDNILSEITFFALCVCLKNFFHMWYWFFGSFRWK